MSEPRNDQDPASSAAGTSAGAPAVDAERVREACIEALKSVRDPEIPVNVVDLGLIYRLDVDDAGVVDVDMTLTTMGCPMQDLIQADVELACMGVEGVSQVIVEFVWSPPWSTERMTEDGTRQMRMFGFRV